MLNLKTLIALLFISPASYGQALKCVDIFALRGAATLSVRDLPSALPNLILGGKDAVRYQKMSAADKVVFEQIISLTQSQLQELGTRNQLEIYQLFARWNLIPPVDFINRLFASFSSSIDTWSAKNHLAFAAARKLTPSPVPDAFLQLLKKNILAKFSSWNVNTQMNVLGAELFSQTFFTSQEMNRLLNETRDSLRGTEESQRIQALKELYRGIRYLRSSEPSLFYVAILGLEEQLERHMRFLGLTLNSDGTSGTHNQSPNKAQTRLGFELRLDALFGVAEKMEEYSNPAQLGFYDPVDLLYANRWLVVEWDGPHHYFQNMVVDAAGAILGFAGNVLRPLDQIKDKALRNQGYDILRISNSMNSGLENIDLPALIESQNRPQ